MSLAPMKRSDRRPHRTAFGLLVASGLVGLAIAPVQTGCATQTTTVSTRALERSGRSSFVCLDDPRQGAAAIHPLSDCTASTVVAINDYTTPADAGVATKAQPHLYALVTQTTRGEVAVIDTTSANNSVLDQDPTVPGANFLPIGAQPVDIVSTPGGTATFVGVAEVGREGLFALPSLKIRPASANGSGGAGGSTSAGSATLPEISAWPSCRLPAAPGQMLLVSDPEIKAAGSDKAATRPACDAAYGATSAAGPDGNIDDEGNGRQKLVVSIPSMGGVAVIDAQTLLDTEPGKYAPCNVERWLELRTDVPVLPAQPPADGQFCVNPKTPVHEQPKQVDSRPTGLAHAAGRLYASDLDTALIHVIDLPTPCEPVEIRPLLPTSVDNPQRDVTTSHVAVAPTLTPDLKRYLYAIDALDGSAMVFDVSDDQSSQFPVTRPNPAVNPFSSSDRIRFSAPVADLLIVQRDIPETDLTTGVATTGVRCDPDPGIQCDLASKTCDIRAVYRTDINTYGKGAGPFKLRGTFAFLALTSGRIAVIDIDDYDAACRGPSATSSLYGCTGPQVSGLVTAQEVSCNVVLPNAPRMGTYNTPNETGRHQPGIQGFPALFDFNGAPINEADPTAPHLFATLPAIELDAMDKPVMPPVFQLSVGGSPVNIDMTKGSVSSTDDPTLAAKHTLMMNLEDPRAQLADQTWVVVFEGPLPGFGSSLAGLQLTKSSVKPTNDGDTLTNVASRFCDGGVQSQTALIEKLVPDADARLLADYVHLTSELPGEALMYWEAKKIESPKVCSFSSCSALFGTVEVPTTGRDFRIVEARQDHVDIEPRTAFPKSEFTTSTEWRAATKCCFPALVKFDVRVGNQWEVAGEQTGFLHHVIADPVTGVCRDSCDPTQARRNGRAPRVPFPLPAPVPVDPKNPDDTNADIRDGGKYAFINPMFRLWVSDPQTPGEAPLVGEQFRFITSGAFEPLVVNLSPDGSTLIQPVGMTFVSPTGQLAVTDGSINGLLFVELSGSKVGRTFF